jgi:hypothetical protein
MSVNASQEYKLSILLAGISVCMADRAHTTTAFSWLPENMAILTFSRVIKL